MNDQSLPSRILPHVRDNNNLRSIADGTRGQHEDLSSCAGFKAQVMAADAEALSSNIRIENEKYPAIYSPKQFPSRAVKLFSCESSQVFRQYALLRDSSASNRVIVEWKRYERHIDDVSAIERLELNVKLLAGLLYQTPQPSGFNVLHCLGYYNDRLSSRYGFLFEIPPWADATKEPVRLYDILHPALKSHGTGLPPLGLRFRLAQKIATSFLQIHSSGWAHKSFSSKNVLFFYREDPSQVERTPDFSLPLIAGFEFSRPWKRADLSDRPFNSSDVDSLYRHPRYRLQGGPLAMPFRPEYDVYSLGVALFEIGVWHRIEELIPSSGPDEHCSANVQDAEMMEASHDGDGCLNIEINPVSAAIRNRMKALSVQVGDVYMHVVQRCLSGCLGAQDGGDGAIYLDNLRTNVVDELAKLYA
jgi:hypothetical protein